LIDDDDDFRAALAANLRDDGYEVVEARSDGDMPATARPHDPDILITGSHYAQSVSFCDRFHGQHPSVPIILITALRTDLLEREAASRGFLTLIDKPLDYDELHKLIADR